jgi:hypothetical protein
VPKNLQLQIRYSTVDFEHWNFDSQNISKRLINDFFFRFQAGWPDAPVKRFPPENRPKCDPTHNFVNFYSEPLFCEKNSWATCTYYNILK